MSDGLSVLLGIVVSAVLTALGTLLPARWRHQEAHDEAVRVITTERDAALRTVERLEAAVTAKASEAALAQQIIARQTQELDSLRDRVSDLERLLYARGAAS